MERNKIKKLNGRETFKILFPTLVSGVLGMILDQGLHITLPPIYWGLGFFGCFLSFIIGLKIVEGRIYVLEKE